MYGHAVYIPFHGIFLYFPKEEIVINGENLVSFLLELQDRDGLNRAGTCVVIGNGL